MVTTVVGELMTDKLYPYWKVPPMHAEHAASSSDLLGSCRKNREKAKKQTKKTKTKTNCKIQLKNNIFFPLKHLIYLLSTYLYSLPVPDSFNKQRLIFLHKLFRHFAAGALLSVCSYRIAAFPSFKEFVSQKQSSRIFKRDGILSFSRGLHNQTVVVSN